VIAVPLNEAQRQAVSHVAGPMLVLAGAGSGKTRVLTVRLARLIEEHGVDPRHILAVTFTNKAAGEMRSRVAQLLQREPGGLWIGTFHAICARLLRREAPHIGFSRTFTIYDEDDTEALVRRLVEDLGLPAKLYGARGVRHEISRAKNAMVPPAAYAAQAADPYHKNIARVYEALGVALRRANAMDFDDLLLHPLVLFEAQPAVLARYRERFRFLLVDEYQDTNRAQYLFLQALASGERGEGNLFVVGDDDQSIYGWRGADLRNILDFRKDYPDAHVVHLEQNYRSSQAILDTAYSVIRSNPERAEKRLWTDRTGGDKVVATQAYNEVEEAEFVADEVERLRKTEKRGYSDFAVLYRTNAQSRAFEDLLARRRIPYRLVGGIRFWERREVKDVVAYLRFCFNPQDALSFARIVSVPSRKIGNVTVDAINSFARDGDADILAILAEPGRVPGVPKIAIAPLAGFRAQVESVRATMGVLRPSELLDQIVELMGLRQHYLDGTPQGEARLENLNELRGLAESFDDRDPAQGLEDFLADVREETQNLMHAA
jgi:DNA helicase-2/ATP-dependent DNA helicase PcrA